MSSQGTVEGRSHSSYRSLKQQGSRVGGCSRGRGLVQRLSRGEKLELEGSVASEGGEGGPLSAVLCTEPVEMYLIPF